MKIGWVLLAAVIVLFMTWFFSRRRVGVSRLEVSEGGETFPVVSGTNLDRVEVAFPDDLAGELNLLIVPFEQRSSSMSIHGYLQLRRWNRPTRVLCITSSPRSKIGRAHV